MKRHIKPRFQVTNTILFILMLVTVTLYPLGGCTSKTGIDASNLQHSYPSPHSSVHSTVAIASTPSPSATETKPDRVSTKIYYASSTADPDVLKPEVTYPVSLSLDAKSDDELLKNMVMELIEGPPAEFKDKGFYTTLAPETRLNSIKLEGDTVKVDFNDKINEGGGSCTMDQRRSQIENTLKNVPGHPVKKVVISVNGDTQNVLQP
jgi:spore germination protein GerM